MIAYDIAGVRFNYRVAGVCLDEGRVLLNRDEGQDFWFLPGGRIEIGETSSQALVREVAEELHVKADVGRLLWIVENFFGANPPYHELGLYYEMRLPSLGHRWNRRDVYQTVTDTGMMTEFQWFRLDVLGSIRLMPPFLDHALNHLPMCTEHVVIRP